MIKVYSATIGDERMAGTIIFNSINVNAQNTNAAVFVGETAANGWDSHNKKQLSSGMMFNAFGGFTHLPGNLYILNDNDFLDTLIWDGDREGGITSQT
jgi:hypothetical protein